MTYGDLLKVICGRRALFITPSDIDYIRNKQEITLLRQSAKQVDIIAPENGHSVLPTGIVRVLLTNLKVLLSHPKNHEIVFIGGIPQLIIPIVSILYRNKPLIIDFFISLYDTLVADRRMFRSNSPIAALLKALDRHALSKADYVVVDTREHARYFASMFDVDPGKMAVVYLDADREIYHRREVERPAGLRDKYIVFFFGAMNPVQGIEIILEAAKLLESNENIVFMMIGPVEKITNWNEYAGLSNVHLAGRWLPQEEVADYIAMSDLCLAGHFSATVPKAGRVIPGKAYSYLAMDKPIVLGDNPANRELFSEQTRNVHFVPMGDPQSLADKIRTMAGAPRSDSDNGK